MYNNLNDLEAATIKWSADRGILKNGKIQTQILKLVSEIGEMTDNIAKGNDIKDDIGDCLVLLTNIAHLNSTNLTECWNIAYNDIKDRKGFLNSNGAFIKNTDSNYDELIKAHNSDNRTIKSIFIKETGLNEMLLKIVLVENLSDVYIRLELKPFVDFTNIGNLSTIFKDKSIENLKDYLSDLGEIIND